MQLFQAADVELNTTLCSRRYDASVQLIFELMENGIENIIRHPFKLCEKYTITTTRNGL